MHGVESFKIIQTKINRYKFIYNNAHYY